MFMLFIPSFLREGTKIQFPTFTRFHWGHHPPSGEFLSPSAFYIQVSLEKFDLRMAEITLLFPNLLKVYGPLTQSALFNLTVRGYKGDSLVFTNTTTLPFSPRNVSSFIQMDRTRYQPGDTVKVRVASLRWDHRPHQGRVDASVLVGVCPDNKGRGWKRALGGRCDG